MVRHEDYCTFFSNQEDKDILTRKLFDVNIRLFYSSTGYRNLIKLTHDYLKWCAQTEKSGYKKPHGYSGANAGIPFNIIALANGIVMINPHLIKVSGRKEGLSNCGSLVLEKPIKIWRHEHVTVRYYELTSFYSLKECNISGYLPTVQHEIDHNNGILITDRKI